MCFYVLSTHKTRVFCSYIAYTGMSTMNNMFNSLTTVNGYFYVIYNANMQALTNSFQSLTSVTNFMYFYVNYQLQSLSGSFTSLRSVQTLYFYANGASSSTSTDLSYFCTSAAPMLCPTTTTWTNSGWLYDTDNCCSTFCATSTLC